MIKAGEVAFIKTTGEAVFVLAVVDEPMVVTTHFGRYDEKKHDYPDKKTVVTDKQTAWVRRPSQGSHTGISHHPDSFGLNELETLAEQRAKFIAEQQEIQARFAGNKSEASESKSFLA